MKKIQQGTKVFLLLLFFISLTLISPQQCSYGSFKQLSSNTCVECLTSCPRCTDLTSKCTNCSEGYYFNNKTESCSKCAQYQMTCDSGKNITCQPFYAIAIHSVKCLSTVCKASNCQLCPFIRANTCTICHPNFTLSKTSICQPINQKIRHLQSFPDIKNIEYINNNLTNDLRNTIQNQIDPFFNSNSLNNQFSNVNIPSISLPDKNKLLQNDSIIFNTPNNVNSLYNSNYDQTLFSNTSYPSIINGNIKPPSVNIQFPTFNQSPFAVHAKNNSSENGNTNNNSFFQGTVQPDGIIPLGNLTTMNVSLPTVSAFGNPIMQNFQSNGPPTYSDNNPNTQPISQNSSQINNTSQNQTLNPTTSTNTTPTQARTTNDLMPPIVIKPGNGEISSTVNCQIGTYLGIDNTCKSCFTKCLTCINEADHCLQCNITWAKYGWKCVKNQSIVFNFTLIDISTLNTTNTTTPPTPITPTTPLTQTNPPIPPNITNSTIPTTPSFFDTTIYPYLGQYLQQFKTQLITTLFPVDKFGSNLNSSMITLDSINKSSTMLNISGVIDKPDQWNDTLINLTHYINSTLSASHMYGPFHVNVTGMSPHIHLPLISANSAGQVPPKDSKSSMLVAILVPAIVGGSLLMILVSCLICYCYKCCCFTQKNSGQTGTQMKSYPSGAPGSTQRMFMNQHKGSQSPYNNPKQQGTFSTNQK